MAINDIINMTTKPLYTKQSISDVKWMKKPIIEMYRA